MYLMLEKKSFPKPGRESMLKDWPLCRYVGVVAWGPVQGRGAIVRSCSSRTDG
jgi:hypothetical protein